MVARCASGFVKEVVNNLMNKIVTATFVSWMGRHKVESALVLIFVAINSIMLLAPQLIFRGQSRTLIRYGDRLPRLIGKQLPGYELFEVGSKGTNLVIYLSPEQLKSRSVGLVKYADLLSQRYEAQGLDVTVVVREADPEFYRTAHRRRANYHILFDADNGLSRKLGVGESESGVFLFDAEGVCRFSTRNPVTIEDMRQLVTWESAHVNPLDTNYVRRQIIEEGQPLGSWVVTDVRTSQRHSISSLHEGQPALFILVSADCSVCSLQEYLRSFAQLQLSARKSGQPEGQSNIILVLDFNFSRSDIVQFLDRFKITAPCYISEEELPTVALRGDVLTPDDRQVAAVQTDSHHNVLKVSSLSSLNATGAAPLLQDLTPLPDAPVRFQTENATLEEMFRDIAPTVSDVAAHGGKYYVSDVRGNRVLVINSEMQIEKEIGRIGSGPGQLLHPGNIGVAQDGTIFVQDGGNERIQRFDDNGRYLGAFPTGTYEGFEVSHEKEIYLGQPESGNLITVYSADGKKLRSFGKLKRFSEIYGAQYAMKDERYKIAVNRVRLFIDTGGDVYVSFMLAPIIQKYDNHGTLLFESRLEGQEIDHLTNILLNNPRFKYLSTSKDGFEARFITLDPVVNPQTKNIYVLLPNGLIYVADRDGKKLSLLRPQLPQAEINLQPFIAEVGVKGEILLIPFLPKRCFRLLPPTLETARF